MFLGIHDFVRLFVYVYILYTTEVTMTTIRVSTKLSKEIEDKKKLYGFKSSYKQIVFNVDDVEAFTNSIKIFTTIPNPSLS